MTAGLSRPLICLVTNRRRVVPAGTDSLLRLIGHAARAGVDLVHIRESDLGDRDLAALVEAAVHAVSGTPARVLVNDRTDVAMVSGAHGVHLRADSISTSRVRDIAPEGFLIGRSVHTRTEAIAAERSGVDYLLAGTVYPTASKPQGAILLGLGGLTELARAVGVPVLAIGGVASDKVGDIAASGAAGVAAIGLFADVPTDADQEHFARTLRELVAALRGPFGPAAPRSKREPARD
jgi:thiamine-phosphate diphosphorylase